MSHADPAFASTGTSNHTGVTTIRETKGAIAVIETRSDAFFLYKQEFARQYKKSIHEFSAKVGDPFIIETTSCFSAGKVQRWYLPPEILYLGPKYEKQTHLSDSPTRVGGTSKNQHLFVAKKVGTFCILEENRQQWLIAKDAMLPDRYIIRVYEGDQDQKKEGGLFSADPEPAKS